MRILQQIGRNLKKTEGAEIAEAAMVLPLVFMLLLGIVWFGRAFNIYSTIQQAAQQGAITAARSSCATCGATIPLPGPVNTAIETVMKASNLDVTQIQLPTNPGLLPCPPPAPTGSCSATSDNVYLCQNVQLTSSAGGTQVPQCGAVVSFRYPFQFYLPFTSLNLQQLILTAQAQSRMEN